MAGEGGEVVGAVAPTAVSLPLSALLGLHPTTTAPTADPTTAARTAALTTR